MQPVIDLSYPLGKFNWKQQVTAEGRSSRIAVIENAPALFREAVRGLSDAQLDTPYRPGGWTVRQVVHHVADSHMNSFVRFRLALTEDNPAVKGYDQVKWSELADSRTVPVESSLSLLTGLHARWTALLRSMTDSDFARTFAHSELGAVPLEQILALYAWHTRHHAAHITGLRERMGWN
jgi:hypothetical protein